MKKTIIVFPLVLIALTIGVSAGFLTTTIRYNPSGWEDDGTTISTLNNNPVNITGTLNVSNRITFSSLTNCDTIDTDGDGVLSCGVDQAGGGGGVGLFFANNNYITPNITVSAGVTALNITSLTIDFDTNITGSTISSGTLEISTINIQGADIFTLFTNTTERWNQSGDNLFPSNLESKIGIGTTSPVEDITIAGNGSISGDLRIDGDLLGSSGIGGGSILVSGWTDDGTIVRLTTTSDKVGIGTLNPIEKLEVVGNIKNNGFINATGNIYSGGDLIAQ